MRGFRSSAGFTLVEALISLALVALMLTMLPASLQIARRAWQSTGGIEAQGRAEAVRELIRTRIAAAVPAFGRGPGAPHQLAFIGRSRSLSFVIDDVDGDVRGLVRYVLEADADGRRLVMQREAFDPFGRQTSSSAAPRTTVLSTDITDFRIRYWGRPETQRGMRSEPQWLDEWLSRDGLPALVEVEIVSPSLGGPAIVAETRMR